MSRIQTGVLFLFVLFVGLLVMFEVGRWLALGRLKSIRDREEAGLGAVDAAVFGLLGLMIAFSFSGAQNRFEWRRQLAVQEANDIGTAYLRLDLLPAASQPAIRANFRRYLDTRLVIASTLDPAEQARELAELSRIQAEIWRDAVAGSRETGNPYTPTLVLSALNTMFDIATTRLTARLMHTPVVIYGLLGLLALASAMLAGYDMAGNKGRNWMHIITLTSVLALTAYVIMDLEFPRAGLIDLRAYDQVLVDLRASMK